MKTFGNFKVPNRGKYKTEELWLRAIYRNNKEAIDEQQGGYKNFKTSVKDYIEAGDVNTVRQAVQKVSRSNVYKDKNEMVADLIDTAMHGKKKEFKKRTGEQFDKDKLHFNSKTKEWDYVGSDGVAIAHFADVKKTGYKRGSARYRV